MSYVLDCVVCDSTIEEWVQEDMHYDDEFEGPYCEGCWFFIERIEKLEKRVAKLEKKRTGWSIAGP